MEGGALSENEFPEFAKDVVPFVHITTRIEGRKDEKLLSEAGGTGFPYVVAMDAAGKVIGKLDWQKRTVSGFRELMAEAKEFTELRAKAEKGDNAAKIKYFPKAVDLGFFKPDEARKYAAGLKNVPADKAKEFEGLIVGLEVDEMLDPLRQSTDPAKRKELQLELGRKFMEMDKAGKIPSQEDSFRDFYALMVLAAEEDKNIPAFERSLTQLKERLGDKLRKQWLDAKEEALRKLKEEKESEGERKDK